MELREYEDLATLLTYETDTRDPQDSVVSLFNHILGYTPDLEYLVLFVVPDPEHPWLLRPCPCPGMESIETAIRTFLLDGRYPVAFWKRKFPTQSGINRQNTPSSEDPKDKLC